MAGIPKRHKGESNSDWNIRVWEAELTRRDNKLIKQLESQRKRLKTVYDAVDNSIYREWLRAIRAKPGSKYDITARNKKK